MGQPVLAVDFGSDLESVVPHLLPCRIHYDGPVDHSSSHWAPDTSNAESVAYFRGKRLQGKTIEVPDQFRGIIIDHGVGTAGQKHSGDESLASTDKEDSQTSTQDTTQSTSSARGQFDRMVIWTHEGSSTDMLDIHTKALNEWLQLSAKIHGTSG